MPKSYKDLGSVVDQCKIEGRDASKVIKPFIGRQGSKKEILRCLFDIFPPSEDIDVFCDLFMGSGVVGMNWVNGLDVMPDGSIRRGKPAKDAVIKGMKPGSMVVQNDLVSVIPLAYEKFGQFTDAQLRETAKLFFDTSEGLIKDCNPAKWEQMEKKREKKEAAKVPKECPEGFIRNPATGRCVKRDGPVGRKILKGGAGEGEVGRTKKEDFYFHWMNIFGKNPKAVDGGVFRMKGEKAHQGKVMGAQFASAQPNGCGRPKIVYELDPEKIKKYKEKKVTAKTKDVDSLPKEVEVGKGQPKPDGKLYSIKRVGYTNKMEEGVPHKKSDTLTPMGVVNLSAASLGSAGTIGHGFVYRHGPIPLERLTQMRDIMAKIRYRNKPYEKVLELLEDYKERYKNKKIFVFADPPYPDVLSYFATAEEKKSDLYGGQFDQQKFEQDMYDFGVKTNAKICITNGNPDPANKQFTGEVYKKVIKNPAFKKNFIADLYAERRHNGRPYWYVYTLKVSAKRNVSKKEKETPDKDIVAADQGEEGVKAMERETAERQADRDEVVVTNYRIGEEEVERVPRDVRERVKLPTGSLRIPGPVEDSTLDEDPFVTLKAGGGPWGDIIRVMLNKYRNYITGH
jgi:site-specific DNA-adenine methylase